MSAMSMNAMEMRIGKMGSNLDPVFTLLEP